MWEGRETEEQTETVTEKDRQTEAERDRNIERDEDRDRSRERQREMIGHWIVWIGLCSYTECKTRRDKMVRLQWKGKGLTSENLNMSAVFWRKKEDGSVLIA